MQTPRKTFYLAALALLVLAGSFFSLADDAPPPPGEGDGEGGGPTNPPPYSVEGLKLYAPTFEGEYLRFWILEGETNAVYDLFLTPSFSPPVQWHYWGRTEAGQTNFLALNPLTEHAFFLLGTLLDTDEDGLTDAYERFVSKTDPEVADQNVDTDGDGIPDLAEIELGLHSARPEPPLTVFLTQPGGYSALP
jgi:hypothetical protein